MFLYGNNNDGYMTAGNGKEIINIYYTRLYLYIVIYYIISYFLRVGPRDFHPVVAYKI